MKKALTLVLFLLVLCGLGVWGSKFFSHDEVLPPVVISEPTEHCGFTVTDPLPNSKVNLPLVIKGTVDNTDHENKGCSWQMFEGQAGSAQLYAYDIDGKGTGWKPIGQAVPTTVADWMTETTTFSITISNDQIGLAESTKMKIVFTEEDAAGFGNADTYELPLMYGGTQSVSQSSVWKTYRNEEYGFEFKYPESLDTGYASFQNTPAAIVSKIGDKGLDKDGCYFGDEVEGSPKFSRVTINSIPFCLVTGGGVGAGQRYDAHDYTTKHDDIYITLQYVVHTSNGCGVFMNSDDLNSSDNQRYNECLDFVKNYDSLVLKPIQESVATLKFTK